MGDGLRPADFGEILRLRNLVPLFFIVLFSWLIMDQPASSEEPSAASLPAPDPAASPTPETPRQP